MDSVTIALHQLNRAIDLYFNDRDFISTLTLSNSAQAILRKKLSSQSQVKACEDVIFNKSLTTFQQNSKTEPCVSFHSLETEREWEEKATEVLMTCCESVMKLNLPRSIQVSAFVRAKSKMFVCS
ncbi:MULTISPECIES: hypothetical protein [Aliivibrio]|uniref:Uncharacterized protein n=1 Tax=Aliivibrio finisterrensis TaxID=511998 RepID=A0A4Q5KU82_9GAMM|nr:MULTISPECIES: hypothetical protein [Aliivibrio]MDD9178745.1 hypothetical protein [Aliivibrio sp. A6]RYU48895.1 hypothetical protein ERW57_16885 [Aliivibrio finisterrensis]RYU55183.1 hypothetical protein ERW56_05150 [Aliivibrio finisterrensis]RYU59842.1 hypothetical protein ERW50_05165 [Aliivibrio finisterrensis]RYU65708.1 hypothetical protein ERW53_05760 [Aliivibrio finisterrensis]